MREKSLPSRDARFRAGAALIAALALAAGGGAAADGTPKENDAWKEAEPGYRYRFPRDHAAHPDYRVEWWYYTGHLESRDGRRFGYQLTFFRTGVRKDPENPSRWAVRDLYLAHFAVSDLDRARFRWFERINRRGIGWAGAETETYRVWNEDWEARLEGRDHVLRAGTREASIRLRLAPSKPPVIHGERGISRKGSAEGNASHYYSLTRMETSGVLRLDGEEHRVGGLGWMDHEFGTTFLEEGQVGWDWVSAQFDDGSELMLYRLRRSDGSADPHSSGTWVDAEGNALPIEPGSFTLEPLATWRSEATGAEYPVRWKVRVPALELELEAAAAFPAQELRTERSAGVSYYEGSIELRGRREGRPVRGRGYLEMTGYAGESLSEVLGGGREER